MSPVIEAHDKNRDRVIDQSEIAGAAAALKTLDKNGDGQLTQDEIRPKRPVKNEGGADGESSSAKRRQEREERRESRGGQSQVGPQGQGRPADGPPPGR